MKTHPLNENPNRGLQGHEPSGRGLARGLGIVSLGLGLAGLTAPREIARCLGVRPPRGLFQALGLREIISGVGLLVQRRPIGWAWSRVVGDLMDLTLVGLAFHSRRPKRSRLAVAAAVVAGATAFDIYCSRKLRSGAGDGAIHVSKAITVRRPPAELYQFWKQLDRLPEFMSHLQSVQLTGERQSHWTARGPAGSEVEWDAEIINDHPDEMIAWQSLEGSDVDNAGSVRFTPAAGGRGTVVKVELQYRPPAGRLGAAIASLFGENPEKQIQVDLLRFKQLMETGEISTTQGQPAGRSRSTSKKFDDWVRR